MTSKEWQQQIPSPPECLCRPSGPLQISQFHSCDVAQQFMRDSSSSGSREFDVAKENMLIIDQSKNPLFRWCEL